MSRPGRGCRLDAVISSENANRVEEQQDRYQPDRSGESPEEPFGAHVVPFSSQPNRSMPGFATCWEGSSFGIDQSDWRRQHLDG